MDEKVLRERALQAEERLRQEMQKEPEDREGGLEGFVEDVLTVFEAGNAPQRLFVNIMRNGIGDVQSRGVVNREVGTRRATSTSDEV